MCEMRLEQFIDTQSDDQLLFIGSASGYFFVGTPREFKESREEVEEKIKKRFRLSYMDKARDVRKLLTVIKVSEDPEEYATVLEIRARQIRDELEKLNRMNERLTEFQPLNERIVKDYYHKALGGLAIIVDGQEDGRYWTKEEWDNDHESD